MILIKVTLSPLDKYKRFHPANLLSIFSRIEFHIVLSLNLAPKGRAKYFIGRVPYLQPRTFNNKSILCTTPIGTNSDLPRFIFRPETISNQIRIIRRIKIWSRSTSQKISLVMLELDCDALVVEMFQNFVKIIRSNHPHVVFSTMKTNMTLVIDESEEISLDLLNSLLASVRKEN